MNTCRPCGCKGTRSCLICEKEYDICPDVIITHDKKKDSYVYCHSCEKAWPGWEINPKEICPNHCGKSLSIQGVYVHSNFISDKEKEKLLSCMNEEIWDLSQSGRRKQNYGPKCNFKKNKIQVGNFKGFPAYSKFIQDKMKSLPILKNFYAIEQCSLEYDPKRGASIDPHIDDCWIWGERIVTVNVLGDTYLTMSKYNGDERKYNLQKVKFYPRILDENGYVLDKEQAGSFQLKYGNNENSNATLRIYMPEKSLIVLYGSARYEWEHCVLREDIKSLRICLAYREFTPPYLWGGEKENLGVDIFNKSKIFW